MHNSSNDDALRSKYEYDRKRDSHNLLEIADEFYRIFYGRNLDDGMSAKISSLINSSSNPIAEFFENCANSGEFKTKDLYLSISGQYDTESNICWYGPSATFVVKRSPIYVSIPKDFPNVQKLSLVSDISCTEITLHPGEARKIRATSSLGAQVYSVKSQYVYRPSDHGRPDGRELCYQVGAGDRNHVIIREKTSLNTSPCLVAVSGSLKEWRVLSIIVANLVAKGIKCDLYKENDSAFNEYISQKDNLCFIIASADTFFLCERRVDNARYIYAEHGIAPFKGYSYSAHYKNYDHVMLPSNFLRSRLEELHGPLQSVDIVGYPVISTVNIKIPDIDILFAPTWSHNFDHIRAAQSLVETSVESGLRIAYLGHPDSLIGLNQTLRNKLVEVDDIYEALGRSKSVVTDFSSIGIEAAVLGIPVMLMPIYSLDDFDSRLHQNGVIEVPHCKGKQWDIGPLVDEKNIVSEYLKLMSSVDHS